MLYYFILILHSGYYRVNKTIVKKIIQNGFEKFAKLYNDFMSFLGGKSSVTYCMISHVRGTKCFMKINAA